MTRQKLIRIALVVAALVLIFQMITSCSDEDNQKHAWADCDLHNHSLENITDLSLDQNPFWDHVLIDFKDNVSDSTIREFSREVGLELEPTSEIGKEFGHYKAQVVEGSVPLIHSHLMNHGYSPLIEGVEEQFILTTLAWIPDDPMYQFQWNMNQIEAVEAWTLATGKGVVVAVIDTGVALETDVVRQTEAVRDLEGVSWVRGYDFFEDDDFAWDGHGHGTHVAGTIAQSTDNGYGTVGLAYGATLMPIRSLDSNGSGSVATVADGIRFAAANGADVINMSLGARQSSPMIHAAVQYARNEHGVTIVSAAGNDGKKAPHYPAAYPEVIAVAATQYDGDTTFYSQRGPFVDIAAPGGNVREDQNGDGRPDGILQETVKQGEPTKHFFALFMGTSMASPHVAAVAAMVQEWGVTRPRAVEKVLYKTTDRSMNKEENPPPEDEDADNAPKGYDEIEYAERYGHGLIQADSAVTAAILDPGLLRGILGIIFAMGLFFLVRNGRYLEAEAKNTSIFVLSSLYFATGLFLLPFIMPGMHIPLVASITKVLAMPIAAWDFAFMGITQTPVLASFLLPLAAVLLFLNHSTLKYVAAGMAVGFGAFCMAEAIMLTSYILWIPGGDIIHRIYLVLMSSANLVLAYIAMKGNPFGKVEATPNEEDSP